MALTSGAVVSMPACVLATGGHFEYSSWLKLAVTSLTVRNEVTIVKQVSVVSWHFIFHKVVYRRTWGVVGSLIIVSYIHIQLDFTINYAKSICMRIGPRCDINNVPTLLVYLANRICGLEKCDTLGYFFLLAPECSLVRLILLSVLFIAVIMQYLVKCTLPNIELLQQRLASEDTILQLIKTTCMCTNGLEVYAHSNNAILGR